MESPVNSTINFHSLLLAIYREKRKNFCLDQGVQMKISTMLPWQTRNSSSSTLKQLDSKETHTTVSIRSGIVHIYSCEEWSWNTSEYPNLICGHTTLNRHEPSYSKPSMVISGYFLDVEVSQFYRIWTFFAIRY